MLKRFCLSTYEKFLTCNISMYGYPQSYMEKHCHITGRYGELIDTMHFNSVLECDLAYIKVLGMPVKKYKEVNIHVGINTIRITKR